MNVKFFWGFMEKRLRQMFECVAEAESVCFVRFAHMWIAASCVYVCVKPWG